MNKFIFLFLLFFSGNILAAEVIGDYNYRDSGPWGDAVISVRKACHDGVAYKIFMRGTEPFFVMNVHWDSAEQTNCNRQYREARKK